MIAYLQTARCSQIKPLAALRLTLHSRGIHVSSKALFFGRVFKRTREPLSPPIAPKTLNRTNKCAAAATASTDFWHGYERKDEYSWMQDPGFANELGKYLKEESNYAKQSMRGSRTLQQQISKIMSKAMEVDNIPPPVKTRSGDFVYYVRQNNNGSVLYCRRSVVSTSDSTRNATAREQILINSEKLAKDYGYSLRHLVISDDHCYIGCLAVKSGDANKSTEMSSLLIFSLDDSGKTKHLETLESVFNFVFGLDGSLFYSVLNDKLRAFKIFGHQIGRPQSERACIFTEDNEELFVDITRTKDKRFHIINSSALDSSEVYIFDSKHKFWPAGADHKQSNAPIPLTLVRPRQKGVEYFVDHHNGEFAILTNSPRAESADKKQTASPLPFRLVRAPTLNPTSENWTELLSVADDETIEDVEIFKDHIMITIKRKGRPAVLIYDKNNQFFSELPLPYGGCCTVRPDSNPQLDTSSVRLRFSSPVHLDSVAKYDMRTMRQTQSWASTPLHIDPSRYSIQRVDVRNGNTNVPLTLVCQKSNMRAKGKPTLLRVYGAYGVSLEPEFRLEDIPLLLRGWTIALAHVRGGSELGREWYFGGKGKNKINSVHDLLACACFLLNREWTTCERLAISGVSAGGLVVGAALSMSPEYFRAATLHVPFVDPLSAMLDPKLPLTSVEVAEWGDPLTSQSDFEAIRQYAPYDNTHLLQKAKHVPSVLVTAGGQDKRVSVWQPAKWVARMRDSGRFVPNSHSGLQTDSHNGSRLLFYPKMNEGHFHANSNQSDSNDEDGFISAHAFRNAFLIDEVE